MANIVEVSIFRHIGKFLALALLLFVVYFFARLELDRQRRNERMKEALSDWGEAVSTPSTLNPNPFKN